MTSLHQYRIRRARCRAHDCAITNAERTGKKEVDYFSAMPADGMTAAHSPGEDFGTSRSHRQLLKGYAVSQRLGNASHRRVLNHKATPFQELAQS